MRVAMLDATHGGFDGSPQVAALLLAFPAFSATLSFAGFGLSILRVLLSSPIGNMVFFSWNHVWRTADACQDCIIKPLCKRCYGFRYFSEEHWQNRFDWFAKYISDIFPYFVIVCF
jgi:hypothetical protein